MLISSRANPSIKRIRSLRTRKERDNTGLFFVEGIRIVAEALESGADVETCVVAPDVLTSRVGQDVVQRLRQAGVPVLEVTPDLFDTLSLKKGPQGIGAVLRQRWTRLDAVDPTASLCWVALDAVQDPGNLGTILRTCDAVGAAGVFLIGQTTDPYDPSALRASMGAIFSQQLVRVSFDQLTSWTRAHSSFLIGTSDAAGVEYRHASYERPLILLMGSERQGLSREQQAQCNLVVKIPMVGKSDSLNLAVATGVMLYEIFHQYQGDKDVARTTGQAATSSAPVKRAAPRAADIPSG